MYLEKLKSLMTWNEWEYKLHGNASLNSEAFSSFWPLMILKKLLDNVFLR
jgi:hypothetical protein